MIKITRSTHRLSSPFLMLLSFLFFSLKSSSQPKVLWKFDTGTAIYGTATIHNQMVYFGSGNHNFYALNKISGKVVWKFKTN
ncbi:PQQ-binding-like beta-propeller repeat protein [Pedobacter sp. LMG 31462]|uniref:PQQ-binding-like beta-propeller repeat protein n=2 Tax=Pedobacter gandavensis TaxID=2679963 RepID=A0ABR6EVE8_9SPHI|nr:PQQ-binding-like beta-propeller repeat protein [Pedobacter gandavensis]